MITYSAPGKIIISGEHVVVYGRPALVSAIDLRLKFSVFDGDKQTKNEVIRFISTEVIKYLKLNKITYKEKNFNYKIDSQIPIGRGMGSSAALSTTGAASFLEFYTGNKFSKNIINNVGFNIEKYFHSRSSGVDVAVSCLGGLIYYRKEFDFLRNICSLDFNLPDKIVKSLFLIDTGKPVESTGEMVTQVANWYHKNEEQANNFFDKIEKITKTIVLCLKESNVDLLKKSINLNQKYLEDIGVVSQTTKKTINNLKKFGVGKITGAGGSKSFSGFILFLSNDSSGLRNYCQKNDLKLLKFTQSKKGLENVL